MTAGQLLAAGAACVAGGALITVLWRWVYLRDAWVRRAVASKEQMLSVHLDVEQNETVAAWYLRGLRRGTALGGTAYATAWPTMLFTDYRGALSGVLPVAATLAGVGAGLVSVPLASGRPCGVRVAAPLPRRTSDFVPARLLVPTVGTVGFAAAVLLASDVLEVLPLSFLIVGTSLLLVGIVCLLAARRSAQSPRTAPDPATHDLQRVRVALTVDHGGKAHRRRPPTQAPSRPSPPTPPGGSCAAWPWQASWS